jgi:hypothetical protein
VHEIVIAVADLYFPEARDAPAAPDVTLPGFAQIARFGERATLEHGWREWLARWAGRDDLARVPPSVVAAAGASSQTAGNLDTWIATPLHLAAGLTTLHFDIRGILRLAREELEELALDFRRSFHDAGSQLLPLESGEFVLHQPTIPSVATTEPARIAASGVAEALPRGEGAPHLRRLGGEIEMWLHEHPVNRARSARDELAVSTLWIWGGGVGTPVARTAVETLPRAYGSDSYLHGLWQLSGGEVQSLPEQLEATFSYAESAALVVEAGRMLRIGSGWSVPESLVELDQRFVAPAVEAVRRRELDRVSILVNDRCLALSTRARRRFWRRPRPVIESLR